MRQLNATYRDRNSTTDVLSFALAEASVPGVPTLLGDVVVSVEQAARQAPDGDLEAEITRLLVHGFCHLRGYDHQRPGATKRMQREEARLLVLFELDSGLIDRAGRGT